MTMTRHKIILHTDTTNLFKKRMLTVIFIMNTIKDAIHLLRLVIQVQQNADSKIYKVKLLALKLVF